ncbi:MAG: hypothetical protein GY846_25420 [Deltaproteobacteria bacterium]|nr:hypothetical protein [Deltaproteobacteria bacterium]
MRMLHFDIERALTLPDCPTNFLTLFYAFQYVHLTPLLFQDYGRGRGRGDPIWWTTMGRRENRDGRFRPAMATGFWTCYHFYMDYEFDAEIGQKGAF